MSELHTELSSNSMSREEFAQLLTELNYNDEQIAQLLVKFDRGDILEAQDQNDITSAED